MKTVVMFAAACALAGFELSGAAEAADMSGVMGNTIQVTTAGGAVVKYYFETNGTYSEKLPDGTTVAGSWTDDGKQLCLTQTSPAGAGLCTPSSSHKVGDTWTMTDAKSGTSTITVLAGHI